MPSEGVHLPSLGAHLPSLGAHLPSLGAHLLLSHMVAEGKKTAIRTEKGGSWTCPRERAQAKGMACVPNGWLTCPREHARAKWRAHIPKGEFMFSWVNLGFPI